MTVLPMFPLGSVLLPGQVLPLHVFEPRYRTLVRDCVAAEAHEFGVVLIDRGSEVGGGDRRTDVGVVARLVQVAELDDGRFAVIAVGTRRIRVNDWLPDDPYPLADVEDWPDDEPDDVDADLAARVDALAARVRRIAALAIELGDASGGEAGDLDVEVATDPLVASFQLATLAPLGPADGHRLLCAASPLARLELLDALLDDVEATQQFRLLDP